MRFTEYNSNAWSYTFEFWIRDGKIWVEYNNNKPTLLKDLLLSRFYPEVKDLLKELVEYLIERKHNFPLVNFQQPWSKILIDFIQTYFYLKDRKLDVIIKSNGNIILNLEESIKTYREYKKKKVIWNGKQV